MRTTWPLTVLRWDDPAPNLSGLANGIFFRNSCIRIADISDGASKTVFFGEQTPLHSDSTWVGIVPNAKTCPTPAFAFAGCDEAAPQINVHSGPGLNEYPPVIHPPNNSVGYVDEMYSEHVGGCNVLMGDDSVHFISDEIDQLVWLAMATRNGGESYDESRFGKLTSTAAGLPARLVAVRGRMASNGATTCNADGAFDGAMVWRLWTIATIFGERSTAARWIAHCGFRAQRMARRQREANRPGPSAGIDFRRRVRGPAIGHCPSAGRRLETGRETDHPT